MSLLPFWWVLVPILDPQSLAYRTAWANRLRQQRGACWGVTTTLYNSPPQHPPIGRKFDRPRLIPCLGASRESRPPQPKDTAPDSALETPQICTVTLGPGHLSSVALRVATGRGARASVRFSGRAGHSPLWSDQWADVARRGAAQSWRRAATARCAAEGPRIATRRAAASGETQRVATKRRALSPIRC